MFEQDYLKRQINSLANALSVALFGKKKFIGLMEDEDEDLENDSLDYEVDIFKTFLDYSLNKDIKKGQKALFDRIKKNPSKSNLVVALSFYDSVLKFGEDSLKNKNFSKKEAEDDIEKLSKIYKFCDNQNSV
ncbi:MAG: DUF6483 family protein [Oscillospiraceae bacterium]|jgi:hypothetical protein|nr:DUF6483 family protein [Oscillospiraceae bacterium]